MKTPLDGRGTRENPENRFERIHVESEPVEGEEDERREPTIFYRDTSRSALAENDSPDLSFRFSVNPYRGCEHGCIYCYARPTHEYLSFSAGLDFEQRIMVKDDAPALLRATFSSPRWEPQIVSLSGNTDCYQPVERRLGITRRCLEVFAEYRNPVGVITKSALVTRDVDVLADLARDNTAAVFLSVTSLDPDVARRMEPRAARPDKRLAAIETLARAGIPVGVMVAPVVPGLNDAEIPAILARAAAAGARSASWVLLRLPRPVDTLFDEWLGRHFPDRKTRVLGRMRECRDGRLYDARFGHRQRGTGPYAEQIRSLFAVAARHAGLHEPLPPLNTAAFRRPGGQQLRLL